MKTVNKKSSKPELKVLIHPTHLVKISEVNLNDWNPNFVNKSIKAAIENDIEQNGYLDPIILQKYNKRLKKDLVIINGEHRYKIMQHRGEEEISAIVLDVDDKKAKALTIRLNREHGELFPDKMSLILKDLSPKMDFDVIKDYTFMDQADIKMFTEVDTDDIKKQMEKKNVKNVFKKEVTCPECGHKFEL